MKRIKTGSFKFVGCEIPLNPNDNLDSTRVWIEGEVRDWFDDQSFSLMTIDQGDETSDVYLRTDDGTEIGSIMVANFTKFSIGSLTEMIIDDIIENELDDAIREFEK